VTVALRPLIFPQTRSVRQYSGFHRSETVFAFAEHERRAERGRGGAARAFGGKRRLPTWIKPRSIPILVICCPMGSRRWRRRRFWLKEGFTVLPYINADPVWPNDCRTLARQR